MELNIGDLLIWTYNEPDTVYNTGTIIGFGRRTLSGNKEYIIEIINKKTKNITVQYITQQDLEEDIKNNNVIIYKVNNDK